MNLSDEILKLLRKSKTVSGNDHWLSIGRVTERDIEKLKHVNDFDLVGYQRIIDVSALKHAMKDHPNLTESDFCLIPLIVECPDIVGQGKIKILSFIKRF